MTDELPEIGSAARLASEIIVASSCSYGLPIDPDLDQLHPLHKVDVPCKIRVGGHVLSAKTFIARWPRILDSNGAF